MNAHLWRDGIRVHCIYSHDEYMISRISARKKWIVQLMLNGSSAEHHSRLRVVEYGWKYANVFSKRNREQEALIKNSIKSNKNICVKNWKNRTNQPASIIYQLSDIIRKEMERKHIFVLNEAILTKGNFFLYYILFKFKML